MNSNVKNVMRSGVSAGAVLAVILTAVPAAHAGAGTVAGAGETCPATVILAARGSEENDRQTPLSTGSNGWEGPSVRRLLDLTLTEHPEVADLLDDGSVVVTGIDPDHYPARLPLPGPGEDITVPALVDGVVLFGDSTARGIPGGRDQVAEWERDTGCRPDYVTVGYSQGQIPLLAVQHDLAQQGRLRGALAFGNPFHSIPVMPLGPDSRRAGFPAVPVGTPALDYCVPDDVVCDTNLRSVYLALADDDDAGVHADYFKDAAAGRPSEGDRRIADTLADWLS